MVVTRRAARAAAEEAAAAAAQAAAVDIKPADTALVPDAVGGSQDGESSVAESRVEAGQRGVGGRLWIGHLCAIVGVATVVHAALLPRQSALPWHALILLAAVLPLRAVLAVYAHSLRRPVVQSGITLALSAAVLFSSNALHVLATRTSPERILVLIGLSAVDICAAWMNMTVRGKNARTEPFAIVVALIYSAADIFLAAVVAKLQAFVQLFFPFLALRFVLNLRLLVVCSVVIVRRDEDRKREEGER